MGFPKGEPAKRVIGIDIRHSPGMLQGGFRLTRLEAIDSGIRTDERE